MLREVARRFNNYYAFPSGPARLRCRGERVPASEQRERSVPTVNEARGMHSRACSSWPENGLWLAVNDPDISCPSGVGDVMEVVRPRLESPTARPTHV